MVVIRQEDEVVEADAVASLRSAQSTEDDLAQLLARLEQHPSVNRSVGDLDQRPIVREIT